MFMMLWLNYPRVQEPTISTHVSMSFQKSGVALHFFHGSWVEKKGDLNFEPVRLGTGMNQTAVPSFHGFPAM